MPQTNYNLTNMSISIINGTNDLFEHELAIVGENLKYDYDSNKIDITWTKSAYKTSDVIENLITQNSIVLYLLFDNNQSGYIKTVPFNSKAHTIYNADVRGLLEISIVGVASKECLIETIYQGQEYAFPKNSQVLQSNISSNVKIPIGAENEKFSESYLKCKHVKNLQEPYRLDYSNAGFIVLNVQNEQIQKKWIKARSRNNFLENPSKESIGFASGIWGPILYEILLEVYLNHDSYSNGSKLWYKSLEQEDLINPAKIKTYKSVKDSATELFKFIRIQVDDYIFKSNGSWTVNFLFNHFCS